MFQTHALCKSTLMFFVLAFGLTACGSATVSKVPEATKSTEMEGVEVATSTPEPLHSSTPTITLPPSTTPIPLPSATATPTSLPVETETPTPSATPNAVQPGLYAANGCVSIHLPQNWRFYLDFCVIRIEVDRNRNMLFTISWTSHVPIPWRASKGPDAENRSIYLTDELGNRYDHIATSGTGTEEYEYTYEGETIIGIFIFPPANPGARIFTFHDDANHEGISNLVLVNPIIIREVSTLNWYPFSVEYLLEDWTASRTAQNGLWLTHNRYPACQLIEWTPGELVGSYKNTMVLGLVTYDLYGWTEKDWSVREYLAINGLAEITEEVQPFFHLQVPYEDAQNCIFDASEVLGSLFAP